MKSTIGFIVALLCLYINLSISQSNSINEKKLYSISRALFAPRIDGDPADDSWKNASITGDFIQFEPKPLVPANSRTEAKLLYDNEAIYILVSCHDSANDVRKEMSPRDDFFSAATDYVSISFDTYNDDQNGFRFVIGASGVQADAKVSNNNVDFSWDGVWESKVKIENQAWYAEVKIPFYNLRFPKKDSLEFGFQMSRKVFRTAETSVWSPLDPAQTGSVIQWGRLVGLQGIKTPIRLQLWPYIATQLRSNENLTENNTIEKITGQSVTGGMDIKYGINDAFTMDMTLIPNFGQVVSDQRRLNNSPFELYFEERRPFFTEGTELFSKGDIFYSRRIGASPGRRYHVEASLQDNEIITHNPTETQMLNATKITGRTSSKLGMGFLNAIVAPTFASIKDTITNNERKISTSDLTNYNVIVLDQLFKNNSSISLINTSTIRNGNERDANVTALQFAFQDTKNNYRWTASGRTSQIKLQGEWNAGYTFDWSMSKVSGQWNWNFGQSLIDANWNPSDLGYFQQNNLLQQWIGINYNTYEPGKRFLQTNTWYNINYTLRDVPRTYQDLNFNTGFWGRLKNQMSLNYWINFSPYYNDYFEPRQHGKVFRIPTSFNVGGNINFDRRKKLSGYIFFSNYVLPQWGTKSISIGVSPRYRISSNFNIEPYLFYGISKNDRGYNFTQYDGSFGERSSQTVISQLNLNANFTQKSNLTIGLRHFWSKYIYNDFYHLNNDGSLTQLKDYYKNSDLSQNFFNIDLIYTWQFAQGSFLSIAWKNSQDNYNFSDTEIRNANYFQNFRRTIQGPQNNSLLVKLNYFIDYYKLKNSLKL